MSWLATTPREILDVLLRGNPSEISRHGLVGLDADSKLPMENIAALEEMGFKMPGKPMTVQQLAMALVAGAIPPNTRIVEQRNDRLVGH